MNIFDGGGGVQYATQFSNRIMSKWKHLPPASCLCCHGTMNEWPCIHNSNIVDIKFSIAHTHREREARVRIQKANTIDNFNKWRYYDVSHYAVSLWRRVQLNWSNEMSSSNKKWMNEKEKTRESFWMEQLFRHFSFHFFNFPFFSFIFVICCLRYGLLLLLLLLVLFHRLVRDRLWLVFAIYCKLI